MRKAMRKKKAKKANQRMSLKRKTAHFKEINELGRKTAHLNYLYLCTSCNLAKHAFCHGLACNF